jgi:hypothetical protein
MTLFLIILPCLLVFFVLPVAITHLLGNLLGIQPVTDSPSLIISVYALLGAIHFVLVGVRFKDKIQARKTRLSDPINGDPVELFLTRIYFFKYLFVVFLLVGWWMSSL